jgi:very-short-patch-repair endonuclease
MKLTGPKETIERARWLRANMSLPERILWEELRSKKTGLRFRNQHPAGPYVLDFYCFEAGLCVEIDGQQHDWTVDADANRDRWLKKQGVRTVRIQAKEVFENLEGVVEHIVEAATAPSVTLCATAPPEGEKEMSKTA